MSRTVEPVDRAKQKQRTGAGNGIFVRGIVVRRSKRFVGDDETEIEHAVRAGEALARARDLCDAGQWADFVGSSFDGSMRTAQKYMRLARNWPALQAASGGKLQSQANAAKALMAIMKGDEQPRHQGERKSARAARGASLQRAVSLTRGALELLRKVDAELGAMEPPTYVVRNIQTILRAKHGDMERLLGELGVTDEAANGATEGYALQETKPEEVSDGDA